MFLLEGAGLGAHTCASRMCVPVPGGESTALGRGSGCIGWEAGPCAGGRWAMSQ